VTGLQQGQVARTHDRNVQAANLEAAYACGFMNSWPNDAIAAIATVEILARLTETSAIDAVDALKTAADRWGASSYIAKKVAYLKDTYELEEQEQDVIDEIDLSIGHNKFPQLQFSILENIKNEISLFSVARRHTNIFKDKVRGDFRRIHYLNNMVPTPISHEDCAGFILRAVESSLIDTVAAFLVIFNLKDRFPGVVEAIRRNISPKLYDLLIQVAINLKNSPLPKLENLEIDATAAGTGDMPPIPDLSIALYRRSSVFLEYSEFCRFRNDIDRVVGQRLLAPVMNSTTHWAEDGFNDRTLLRKPSEIFDIDLHNTDTVRIDTFYRTYLFLRFIQNPVNLSVLTSDDIKFIFDNTAGLESLLLEDELKTMHLNASDEARALISVLALCLYRVKSSDPDIDFDFRKQLEDLIISDYSGDVSSFIDHLAPSSPSVANYIASSLDEVTLQKMYTIVNSPSAAEAVRKDILMSIGVHLNKIDYIIEAESIETRAKVAKLKNYFDASRMFVDSIAMKKWLDSNPSAYTEQFKEILPRITAKLSKSRSIVTSSGVEATIGFIEFTRTDEYLIEQIAGEAFSEFCRSNEFGIESYLGRRIRHNTLHGVMTSSIDAVLRRSEYNPIIAGTPFGRALAGWENSYKVYIERMRRDFLQFKSESKPNALFNSVMDSDDPATKTNLQQLVNTLRVSGAEMLHDLIISFCWSQIAPQLEIASREIRVTMARDVIQSLDQALLRFNGPEEQKIKSALADAIASVFTQVASWFQIPQTGFVPASIPEICNIIDIEHNRPASSTVVTGDKLATKYYGISVHRIYDCLAVLLQNAFKHGEQGSDVEVKVLSTPIEGTNLHTVVLSVVSDLPEDGADECVRRVGGALVSSETGSDMVTEGYSGIKKVKFITKVNEGTPTVRYEAAEGKIEIQFSLKVEVAGGES